MGGVVRLIGILAAVLVGLFAVLSPFLNPLLALGSGAAAKRVCSAVFLQGRSPQDVLDFELRDQSWVPLVSLKVVRTDTVKQVSASMLWASPVTATYNEGFGCTLEYGSGAQFSAPPLWTSSKAVPQLPTSLHAATQELLVQTLTESAPYGSLARLNTRALIVVHKGVVVGEAYNTSSGWGPDSLLEGWSMSKSLLSVLVGAAVREGLLSLTSTALLPEWQSPDPRSTISLEALLHMTSGLAFREVYDASGDVTTMLFTQADTAAFAAGKTAEAPPDTKWYYSSGTTNILSKILRRAFSSDTEYWAFIHRTLSKIGMESAILEPDASGTWVASSFSFATLRDWARLGLLMANGGVGPLSDTILTKEWVEWSSQPCLPHEDGYGAQWWLAPSGPRKAFSMALPQGSFYASGFHGQFVWVSAKDDLVIVRSGVSQGNSFDLGVLVECVRASLGLSSSST